MGGRVAYPQSDPLARASSFAHRLARRRGSHLVPLHPCRLQVPTPARLTHRSTRFHAQSLKSRGHPLRRRVDLLRRRWREGVKPELSVSVSHVHPINSQRMQVHVQPQRAVNAPSLRRHFAARRSQGSQVPCAPRSRSKDRGAARTMWQAHVPAHVHVHSTQKRAPIILLERVRGRGEHGDERVPRLVPRLAKVNRRELCSLVDSAHRGA